MYSAKELALINALGFGYLVDREGGITPLVLYRMMRDKCFLDDITGPITDSVRKCLVALDRGAPQRDTPEWDQLIDDDLAPRKPLIYIASPYTKGDPCVNTWFQIQVADALMNTGYVVPFVPLLSHFHHSVAPRPYDDWIELDNRIIEACHFKCLLRLASTTDRLNVSGHKQDLMSPRLTNYRVTESSGADNEERLFERLGRICYHSVWDMWNGLGLPLTTHVREQLNRITS